MSETILSQPYKQPDYRKLCEALTGFNGGIMLQDSYFSLAASVATLAEKNGVQLNLNSKNPNIPVEALFQLANASTIKSFEESFNVVCILKELPFRAKALMEPADNTRTAQKSMTNVIMESLEAKESLRTNDIIARYSMDGILYTGLVKTYSLDSGATGVLSASCGTQEDHYDIPQYNFKKAVRHDSRTGIVVVSKIAALG
ncbi:MAG: hypothetical protein WC521_08395 [Bdellovibrionales bacterium]|jgi:hypothetical protein